MSKNITILESSGHRVSMSDENLVIETVRNMDEIKWYINRLKKKGQSYVLVKDNDSILQEEVPVESYFKEGEEKLRDYICKSAVVYRLYSDSLFFSKDLS